MKISDLEFYLVEVPRRGPQRPAGSLLLRLAAVSGVEGWGEAQLPWRPSELAARREMLLPTLSGRSIFDVEELLTLDILQPAPLRAAVEMACWDLIGRAVGQPVCHLLGGDYRQRVPLAVRLPRQPAAGLAALAREFAEQGLHVQVVPASGRVEDDLATLAAVREATAGRAQLRFDGGSRFDHDTALDLCAELEAADLQFFLDPLSSGSFQQLAALARATNVPLAASKGVSAPSDIVAISRAGVARHVVVNLEQVGGLLSARKCAAVAEATLIAASLSVQAQLGVATAAMLHVAAATPHFASANQCACPQQQDDLLREPLAVVDGMVGVPQGPGLGVEIDRGKIEAYQVT